MATPPRGKSGPRRPSSRVKKPAIIDLVAKEVKSTVKKNVQKNTPKSSQKSDANHTRSARSTPSVPRSTPISQPSKKDNTPLHTAAKAPSQASSRTPLQAKTGKSDKPAGTSSAKPNTPPPAAFSSAAKRGSDFGSMTKAGVLSAVVALGGAGILQYTGLLGSFSNPPAAPISQPVDLAPLQATIGDLQNQLSAIQSTPPSQIDLSTIETRIAALETAPPAPVNDNTGAMVGEQLDALKSSLANINQSAAELSARIEALETNTGSAATQTTEFASRLSTLENDATKASAQPTQTAAMIAAAIAKAVAPVAQTSQDQTTQMSQLTQNLASASSQTTTRLDGLETQISALSTKIDEDVDARIADFDEKLKNAATGEKLAKSAAINSLKYAVENGDPFSAALVSLETLSGSSDPIEVLRPHANTGLPTRKILQEEFRGLQNAMLRSTTNDPEAGITQRLFTSIRSLVTITSEDALPGTTPEAIISRISAAMKVSDFDTAISEWNSLPEPARKISTSWMDRLKLRQNGERQLDLLIKATTTSTVGSNG